MKMQVNALKIKQLREQRCWSQLQLSEMAGVSLRTLQRVEAKSVASHETIKSIAAVLEIDCDKLLPSPKESTAHTSEQPSQTEQKPDSKPEPEEKIVTRKELFVTLLILMASAAIGYGVVFWAYSDGRIDHEQFVMFKDIVSGGFLVGFLGLAYRAYKADLIALSKL